MILTILFLTLFVIIGVAWMIYERSQPLRFQKKYIEVYNLLKKSNDCQFCFEEIMHLKRIGKKGIDQEKTDYLIGKWKVKFCYND
jgi:hypothetical protein